MSNKIKFIKPQQSNWNTTPLTAFEQMYGVKGTHIPTDAGRDHIGTLGEIMIDDEVDREHPYAKIGDGEHTFAELDYVKIVKDYYNQ